MPSILVVEDEVALQEAIKTKLAKEEITYYGAYTAEEALKKLETIQPNIIWTDLLMPGMGGINFLIALRENPKYKNIPVVVVSVSAGPEKIRQAFQLNVIDYIVKSQYKLEDIVKKMKTFLTKQSSPLPTA